MMAYSVPTSVSPFKQRSSSSQVPSNVASVLERHHLNRQATPDSEAVASSDDDHEGSNRLSQSTQLNSSRQQSATARPARRASWLSEVSTSQAQRKKSLSGMSPSPSVGGASQPSTPLTDTTTTNNNNNNTPTYFANPFSSNNRSLNRPSALSSSSMIAPSPTTASFDDLRSPMSQTYISHAGVGVPIPTEPLRKTVRSQSYSAGQLEESGIGALHNFNMNRARPGPTHRTSRPSLLGSDNSTMLQSLQEYDDDAEGESESETGPTPLFASHYSLKNSASVFNLGPRRGTMPARSYDLAPEPYDDEDDDVTPRNASLSNPSGPGHSAFSRAATFSTGAFGSSDDPSQSRRHSFATIPRVRNGSVVRMPDNTLLPAQREYGFNHSPLSSQSAAHVHGSQHRDPSPLDYTQGVQMRPQAQAILQPDPNDRSFAVSYFSGATNQNRHAYEQPQESVGDFAVPQLYARPGRVLYIVSFKCARAEIYYIADTMGLELKVGDMVICEGDRGTDLGTIEHTNVTMDEAKRLKQHFNKQHFKNLMMFSRLFPHMAALANDDALLDKTFGQPSSPSTLPTLTGPLEQEPRPKAIKRIANPDEIHLLREKEGNEAKAKRMCQNKTSEHNLRMEILDAEFQHDYKKLTFFYYAEEYINFNELVTDLFKVYKTRIWMSAINAASHSLMNPNHAMRPPPHQHGRPINPGMPPFQPQGRQQDVPTDYNMLTAGIAGMNVSVRPQTSHDQLAPSPMMPAGMPAMPAMNMGRGQSYNRGYASPYNQSPWAPPGPPQIPYVQPGPYGFPNPGLLGYAGFQPQFAAAQMAFAPGSAPRR